MPISPSDNSHTPIAPSSELSLPYTTLAGAHADQFEVTMQYHFQIISFETDTF